MQCGCALQYFPTLSHKWHDFGKLEPKLYILISSTTSVCDVMWSRMSGGLHVQYPLFLSDFKKRTLIFPTIFRKILKFHENPSSESRVVPCGRTHGQTERHGEANRLFSQCCERAEKCLCCCHNRMSSCLDPVHLRTNWYVYIVLTFFDILHPCVLPPLDRARLPHKF